ncbi:MFS transporter [Sulfurisphaera ohwakuensis]|uniref:MFS family permease n=1 Tax=Sulfurisphaera ohwakuensis TaxID=69656 RepID=A0A650CFX2_SULOH|nr:MFS transporter [Sulfurisphaera ohwakuensis]MBB5254042.1 MFS family permease [Sulfurisphaera ohwakuensis]QGR16646.1 MFS transporter [Sulfurisphaera ohwakuensis]
MYYVIEVSFINRDLHKILENAKWTSIHSWAFISFSAGMALEAYIFGMSSIATNWVPVPKILESLLLSWAPLWLIIGIIVTGPLSDRLGRKRMFYLTMSLYAIGAIGIAFSYTYYLILLFLAMLLFAAGGEMNTIMVMSHEIMPRKHRSKAMFFEINFINFGGLLLAAVALSSAYSSTVFQRFMIGITAIIIAVILAYARQKIPESIRWLEDKGDITRAEEEIKKYFSQVETEEPRQINDDPIKDPKKLPPISLRLAVTTIIAAANTIGFGLMTYVLGPYFFPKLTAIILLVANSAEFLAGLGISPFADSISRKLTLLISLAGVVASTAAIYFTISLWTTNLILFWILLVILNVFTSINYLTEDTLKAEIWPTVKRGTYTAIVRFISIGAYIPTIFLTSGLSIYQYILFNLIVWTSGLIAAVVWFVKGIETGKGKSLSEIS